MLNFAAPELFVKNGNWPNADAYEVIQHDRKTVQTDVYAFGCLCYAVSLSIHYLVCKMVTRPDTLQYRAIPRYFPITTSPTGQKWRTSSTVEQSNIASRRWRLECHPPLLDAKPFQASNDETYGEGWHDVYFPPFFTRNSERGMCI